MSLIKQALAEFDETKAAIEMVQSYGTLTLAVDGIAKVEEAHKQVKRLRIDIDKRRKDLNKGALEYQRAVNAEAEKLTAQVSVVEDALYAQRQIHEAEVEKVRAAKAAEKQAVLNARAERLAAAGVVIGDLAALQAMTDDEFTQFAIRETAKAEKARAEAEAARLEAERMEAARLEEIRRQAEELRIRNEEMQRERIQLEQQRAAMLAEQAELQRAKDEHLAAVAAEEARVAAEKARIAEAERQAAELAKRQEEERQAAIAAEEARAAEAEKARLAEIERQARLDRLKPELEKFEMFEGRILGEAKNIIEDLGVPAWSEDAMKKLRQVMAAIALGIVSEGKGSNAS